MKKNFIRLICENEMQNAELALATESISEELQSMVEKLTNIKIKELTNLVKKIKYDGDLQKAESFNQSIGEKLDQIIQSITETKAEIDNEVVKLFNGDQLEDDMGNGMSDLDSDFGGDMGNDLGNAPMGNAPMGNDMGNATLSDSGFDEFTRTKK